MSLIGKKIEEFNAHAYHQGEFLEVSEKDLMGNWSILCFYPADFTFVCPTELEDLQEQYSTLKSLGVEVFLALPIPTLLTKHGMIHQMLSVKSNT